MGVQAIASPEHISSVSIQLKVKINSLKHVLECCDVCNNSSV